MPPADRDFDVLVIGGGPAGIAAATVAARQDCRVGLVEFTPWIGGQIWRSASTNPLPRAARNRLNRLHASSVEVLCDTSVIDCPQKGRLRVETRNDAFDLTWQKLILAVGARERFIPFPGWTLPNCFGLGGLQLLVKNGWPVGGKRIAVAGSGPLLLAVAAKLGACGAQVLLIAEQAPLSSLLRFGMSLPWVSPDKLLQGAGLAAQLYGVPYRTDCWPTQAEGDGKLERVTFTCGGRTWTEACDVLACGFGLVPNLELPLLLGCQLDRGFVKVNEWQATTIENVYCAGEPTGIGGVDRALVEGEIAGYAATQQEEEARQRFGRRSRTHRFTQRLDQAFALREELKTLATPDTIVCRCEDVSHGALSGFDSWKAAKLQTRCGMGECQGRTCGSAAAFLYGWQNDSVRPPIFPARVGSLMGETSESVE